MSDRFHVSRCFVPLALLLLPALALAQPTPGFIEEFPSGLSTWTGGSTLANPGTGGYLGGGDGYLRVSTPAAANLGTNSLGIEYQGNWPAAGVDEIRIYLSDIGADEALEIHFNIGNGLNYWTYNVGFAPPDGSWGQFVIPLNGPTGWTRIIGTGTFADAIANADRIQFRHDRPPFVQAPDPIKADVGIDHIELRGPGATPTVDSSWGRIKRLYR